MIAKHVIPSLLAGVLCFLFGVSAAAHPSLAPEHLIDQIAAVNCPPPGVSETGTFDGFLAEDTSIQVSSTILFEQRGALRYPAPCKAPDAIQNILHAGPAALPALLRHLNDKRPTRLVIGQSDAFMARIFADEYDARHQTSPMIRCSDNAFCTKSGRPFEKPYVVKIGDVCFVLIGQIVNRQLNAARYQPTGILMVNSPVETPALAERVRADWSGVDAGGVRDSLLADLQTAQPLARTGALRRLRYYFPDAYASLTGSDRTLRDSFEAEERTHQP